MPLLYLHVGRNFGIRSLSLSSLSLKSMGPSTVTQHGGVQKMSTRKNMFPKLRKRKRRELQKQWKCCKTALPTHYLCHLQRIWMDFSYRESTILTVYTVRTAQTGTISIQVIQWTSYFLTLHGSSRGTGCLCCTACLLPCFIQHSSSAENWAHSLLQHMNELLLRGC